MRFSDAVYKITRRTIQFYPYYFGWRWEWTGRKEYATCTIYTFGPLFLSVGKRAGVAAKEKP